MESLFEWEEDRHTRCFASIGWDICVDVHWREGKDNKLLSAELHQVVSHVIDD